MRVFDRVEPWPTKINFVDCDNTIVGYDMMQDCCEEAGWYILDWISESRPEGEFQYVLDYYRFDRAFFAEHQPSWLDAGSMVIFRLVPTREVDGPKELFLHLYNAHNGYYAHGFEMLCCVRSGVL